MLGELDPPLPPPGDLVDPHLPLEDLSDDHVPGTVHIVPLLGGHAVPAGEPELLPSIILSQKERGTALYIL